MPDHNPLWIEEPEYAKRYGAGVGAGVSAGLRGGFGYPLSVSPAYCRGYAAGYRAASRRRLERERRVRDNLRMIQAEMRLGASINDPRKLNLFHGGVA